MRVVIKDEPVEIRKARGRLMAATRIKDEAGMRDAHRAYVVLRAAALMSIAHSWLAELGPEDPE